MLHPIEKPGFLILTALFVLSMNKDLSAQEKVLFNETITWNWNIPQWYGGNSFYWWHRPDESGVTNFGEMPSNNWLSPVDYRNYNFYLEFEVISQPTGTPFKIQFGIWQDLYLDSQGSHHRETVSSQVYVSGGNGSQINVSLGKPSAWWNHPDAPSVVDFSRPGDFYRIGIVLWTNNGCVPMSWAGGVACADYNTEQAKFFPMTARVKVKAVYAGGGDPTPYLSVTPSARTVSSTSGSTTFSISSNVDWSASENADWFSVTKTNATTLTVNYNANTSASNRSAAITLSGSGVSNQTVTLNQNAPATLSVSPGSRTVTSAAGSVTYTVSSNIDWSISETSDWLSAVKTNSTTLTVNYDANTAISNRSATITLAGSGVSNQSVTLTQEGVPLTLSVSPDTKTVSEESGSTTFTVSANVDWSPSENSDWLSAAKTNSTTLTLNYNANLTSSTRSATVTLSATGVSNQTVTLNQEGCQVPDAPVVTASDGTFTDKVVVDWTGIENADNYDVYRGQTFLVNTTSLTYTDNNGETSPATYRVIAINACGRSAEGTDAGNVSLPSALEEDLTKDQQPFILFPNPSGGTVTLTLAAGTTPSELVSVIISDLSGARVYSDLVRMTVDNSILLPLNLKPGIYQISLFAAGKEYREKLVIH